MAVGNEFRRDDGAGLVAARALGGLVVAEPVDLLDEWQGFEWVVVLDAVRSGTAPGTIHHLVPPLPAHVVTSSHALGLADVIELGRTLSRLPARLEVYGIEVEDVGPGPGLTPAVEDAVGRLVDRLQSAAGPSIAG